MSEAYRWQAAMGAIAGSLIAGAQVDGAEHWTSIGQRSIDTAEALLRGEAVPIDLAPTTATPVAVGLAAHATPLLVDPTSVCLIDHVRCHLAGAPSTTPPLDPMMARAFGLAQSGDFTTAVSNACEDGADVAVLVGALAGLERGVGAIPARLVSGIGEPDGRRGRRYLSLLTARLLGIDRSSWYAPRRRRAPREVLPGLWLSCVLGAPAFAKHHPNGLVLSLCDPQGALDGHDERITFHLDDTPKADANPSLDFVLDEVLAEVRRARSAQRPVLVHCRHGASRTGLILRLILTEELHLDPEAALTEAQCLWPATSTWNTAWNRAVERRAGQ